MSKIYARIVLGSIGLASFLGADVVAQQRFVLAEEFTNASCGPCASQNPAFNALLDANSTKIIGLKYQVWWPGFDPMHLQNVAEVTERVNYYGVTGAPTALVNGVEIANDCGAYDGAPACLSQTEIDAAYAAPAPFNMTLTHSLSADASTMTIDVTVSSVSAFSSSGALKLHVAIMEREIQFASAPGSNGETKFEGVMRDMVPNAMGTTLPGTWTAGQSQTFNFSVTLPTYIYNYEELAVVAFVQSDGDKAVQNAAYSAPQPLLTPLKDVSVSYATPNSGYCNYSFVPQVAITNGSSSNITSAVVAYTLNGGAEVTQNWGGSLAPGASTTITFPTVSVSGASEVSAYVVSVDGARDGNGFNNVDGGLYSVVSQTVAASPYTQTFEAPALGGFPTEFLLEDVSGRVFVVNQQIANTPQQLGGFAQSSKSLRIDFYAIAEGTVSKVITEKVNLSTLTGPKLYFDRAHAPYTEESPEPDKLEVFASTDCGATWTSLWSRMGAALATVPAVNPGRFYPQANQWGRNEIDLSAFNGQAEVLFKFEATSGFGNCLYIDNIYVGSQPIGIGENEIEGLSVYPVPASSEVLLSFDGQGAATATLTNSLGAVVRVLDIKDVSASDRFVMNVADLAAGTYHLSVENNGKLSVRMIPVLR
ncbi:Omp28-related outer membrane protein [bacterium]|nr:Omp28-related outer membrane protein [bacterium]